MRHSTRAEVDRLVLMEAFLPGVGEWNNVFLLRDLWHFHFFGQDAVWRWSPGPLSAFTSNISGMIFTADPQPSPFPEADRKFYAGEICRARTT